MSVKGSTVRQPKMVNDIDDATIDEAFEAAMGAERLRMRKTMAAPENTSRRSTVSGPVTAAKLCGTRLKEFL